MKHFSKWAARIGFVVAIVLLTWFSIPMAIMAVAATILVAVHARASTLIELSFGPLRAKLERDVTEAETLVKKLKEMAALQAKAAVAVAMRTGRWADDTDWQFQLVQELEGSLRDLGLEDATLQHVRADFVKFVVSDLGFSAIGPSNVPIKLGEAAVAEWTAIRVKAPLTDPEEIEVFLRKWDALTPDRCERVEAMRRVLSTNDVSALQFKLAQSPVEWS